MRYEVELSLVTMTCITSNIKYNSNIASTVYGPKIGTIYMTFIWSFFFIPFMDIDSVFSRRIDMYSNSNLHWKQDTLVFIAIWFALGLSLQFLYSATKCADNILWCCA